MPQNPHPPRNVSRVRVVLALGVCAALLALAYVYRDHLLPAPAPGADTSAAPTRAAEGADAAPGLPPQPVAKGADPFQAHLSKQMAAPNRPLVTVVNGAPLPPAGKDPFKEVLDAQAHRQEQAGVSPFRGPDNKP